MKKLLFILSLAGVVLGSCKKESLKNTVPVIKNAQSVTFNIGFSKSIGSLGNPLDSTNPDTALTNHIKVLYYMVFDSAGNDVHNITQLSTDAAFGHYADNLGPGKYTVAITGGGSTLMIQPGNLTSQYLFYGVLENAGEPGFYVPGPFDQDTYSTFFPIIVAGTPLNPPVSLNRVISKMTVNIDDALPANTTAIDLTLNSVGNVYYAGTGLAGMIPGYAYQGIFIQTATYNFPVPAAAIGTTNFQVGTLFLYNTATPITVNLGGVNTVSQYNAEKNISNVTGAPNKVTLLSGNLFGGNGLNSGNGFKVAIDTTWNAPVVKTF